MYIPKHFQETNEEEIISFMTKFNFATLVTANNNFPTATHLPFVIQKREGSIYLTSHFARANNQWKEIITNKVLVIFSEPHAYISPIHYEKKQNVPTWNYISIHAYGAGKILEGNQQKLEIINQMIDAFEGNYRKQWEELSEDYIRKMLKGIVAFEIKVTDLHAKSKLSQNKTSAERQNVINALARSENSNEKLISEYMKRRET